MQYSDNNQTIDAYNHLSHYQSRGPIDEFGDLEQTPPNIRNVGWTLGNYCPYNCNHCYSASARLDGCYLDKKMIDRIVQQLAENNIETVNLGGNEPIFTNGPDVMNSLVPYLIHTLKEHGIEVGITTSGITLITLYQKFRDAFNLINDVDISLDSPIKDEHNTNRNSNLFHLALKALNICQKEEMPCSIIMAAMKWNFTIEHLDRLMDLASSYGANVRINVLKPTELSHLKMVLTTDQYYSGFKHLMNNCESVEVGDPILAALYNKKHSNRCPCGRTSFRIHSLTPKGEIFISPCVYLHDYKSEMNILENDLVDIINSKEFNLFRQRNKNPSHIEGCKSCKLINKCGGGCAANAYLQHAINNGEKSFKKKDPYCPIEYWEREGESFPKDMGVSVEQNLVHMDYLCTWIGKVK